MVTRMLVSMSSYTEKPKSTRVLPLHSDGSVALSFTHGFTTILRQMGI